MVCDGTARPNAMQNNIFTVLLLKSGFYLSNSFTLYKWAGGPGFARLGPGTWDFASLL